MPFAEVSSNILLVIVGIGSLIFIHELGHFLVAKKIGVRVHVFSLGFGMALISRTWGETEYRLSLIPLGGYVKLAGEHPKEGVPQESWDFMSKAPWQRALVLVAGVVMNAAFALLLFIVAFRVGVPFITSEVGLVAPGWPAWEAGIDPGDNIVEIAGTKNPDFEDVFTAVALGGDRSIPIKVDRAGKILSFNVYPKYDPVHGLRRIGIAPAMTQKIGRLFRYTDGAPAIDAGLKTNDKIIAIDGKTIKSGEELTEIEAQSPGKELTLTILRNGQEKEFKVTPLKTMRWMMGVSCATTKVQAVRAGSLAAQMGLRRGDKILTVNGKEVTGWFPLTEILEESKERQIDLTVKRAGEVEGLHLSLQSPEDNTRLLTGVTPVLGLRVDMVMEGFPAAEKLALMPGDEIVYLAGKTPRSWDDLLSIVTTSEGKEMTVKWLRDGKTLSGKFRPIKDEKSAIGRMGLLPKEKTVIKKYDLIGACKMGTYKAQVMVKRIYLTLTGLFTKKVSSETVGGIILIAQASYESAKVGFGKLLYFMGIISMQLAILNLLPIPVLDGGHLLFLGIEKLKGSPVSERTMAVAQYIGLGLILCLFVFATRNDILRLFMMNN